MSGRTLGVLALLAILAVAAAWYVRQPVPEPSAAAGDNLFLPGLADRLPAVTGVRARIGGNRLLAHVVRDGDVWRVRNRSGYPADPETLRGTLIALSEARRGEAKTDRPDGWRRLGVQPIEDPDATGVELTLEGLDPELRVVIGERASGDAGGTYVRRLDAEGGRAWLIPETIERPDTIADWLDDRLLEIPAYRIRSAEIAARDGEPVRIRRTDSGPGGFGILNLPAGRQPLSNSIARSIARIVADLRLTDVHPAAAVDRPPRLADARFETATGLRITIEAFAAERGEGARYVRLRAEAESGVDDAVRDRVATLNARFDGWLYEIPDYKFVNVTQTLEGVLEPERTGDRDD